MPILTRETDCFPEDLLDAVEDVSGPDARRWWVVYTRSRREKDLMRRLNAQAVPFYCPIASRRSRAPSGRIREAFLPLFPGYVFLYGSFDERVAALTTNCVSSVTQVDDQARLVQDLRQVRRLIGSKVPIRPEELLGAGMRVRVVAGPLRGQEGVVIERLGRRRLLVTVELLRRGASADLDECDVEPV